MATEIGTNDKTLNLKMIASKMSLFLRVLIIFIFLSLFSCDKDDDSTPIEKLPPATQTGEQTFGCLINGEAFIPSKIGGNAPRAFYQFARGAYTLGISASTGSGEDMISVLVGGIDIPEIKEKQYLLTKRESGNYHGEYLEGGGLDFRTDTSTDNPGELIITKFDPENYIVSGTFSFIIKDENGDRIEITDGRFDLNYTN